MATRAPSNPGADDASPPSDPRHVLGQRGEDAATAWLQRAGWRIVTRNWRCRGGELDIIAERNEILACVEVRTVSRAPQRLVPTEASVGAAKRRRLEHAMSRWLAEQPHWERMIRFDIMTVEYGHRGGGHAPDVPVIRHIEGAFTPRNMVF